MNEDFWRILQQRQSFISRAMRQANGIESHSMAFTGANQVLADAMRRSAVGDITASLGAAGSIRALLDGRDSVVSQMMRRAGVTDALSAASTVNRLSSVPATAFVQTAGSANATSALMRLIHGPESPITLALQAYSSSPLSALQQAAESPAAAMLRNLDRPSLVALLRRVEVDSDLAAEIQPEPTDASWSTAQWFLWLWLVRFLTFAFVLNTELQIANGPDSTVKTVLEVLEALKLSDVVAPAAVAGVVGEGYKRLLRKPDEEESSAG